MQTGYGPDALRLQDGGADSPSLHSVGIIPGVWVTEPGGGNQEGTGTIRNTGSNGRLLSYKGPDSDTWGPEIHVTQDGEYVLMDGENFSKYIRVQVSVDKLEYSDAATDTPEETYATGESPSTAEVTPADQISASISTTYYTKSEIDALIDSYERTDEEIYDLCAAIVTGGTQTLITVSHDDPNNQIDFVVEDDLALYDWSGVDTDDLAEGSNLYFTDARARAAVGGILTGAGLLTGDLVPDTDDAYDLGDPAAEFRNAYIDGTAYIDTLEVHVGATITDSFIISGSNNPTFTMLETGTSGSGQTIGLFYFNGQNSVSDGYIYSKWNVQATTWTDGNEKGKIIMQMSDGGVLQDTMTLSGDSVGIGTTGPSFHLDIRPTTGNAQLGVTAVQAGMDAEYKFGTASYAYTMYLDDTNGEIVWYRGGAQWKIDQNGVVTQDGNFLPAIDDANDLGAAGSEWKDLYLDGTAYIDTLEVHVGATFAGAVEIEGGFLSVTELADTHVVIGGRITEARFADIGGTESFIISTRSGGAWPFDNYGNLYIGSRTNNDRTVIISANTGTPEQLVLLSGGNVGINDATPGFQLDVNGTFRAVGASQFDSSMDINGTIDAYATLDGVTGDQIPFSYTTAINDSNLGSSWLYANYYIMTISGSTTTTGRMQSFYSRPNFTGTGAIGELYGFVIDPYFDGSTGNVTYYSDLKIESGAWVNTPSSTITNFHRVKIENAGAGFGVTGLVGVYLQEMTRGSGANYQIYSEGGNSYFGSGDLEAVGAITPGADDTYDLGGAGVEFKDLYLDGTAYIDTLQVHVGINNNGSDIRITDTISMDNATAIRWFDSGAADSDNGQIFYADDESLRFTSNAVEALRLQPDQAARFSTSLYLLEQAAALADQAGYGQIWVKNETPNELWFTDDAGTDFQLGLAGSGATAALDNLASVAINTSLISDTDDTDDLGSAVKEWKDLYIDGTAYIDSLEVHVDITLSDGVSLNLQEGVNFTGATGENKIIAPNGLQEALIIEDSNGNDYMIFDTDDDEIQINQTVSLGDNDITNMGFQDWNASGYTIAAGAITVTTPVAVVDTEGAAASDNLDTISGGSTWQLLMVVASDDARTVVLKDGTGNLRLTSDFFLTHTDDTILLRKFGANWVEVCRSNNTA